jgi:hypothetical protein
MILLVPTESCPPQYRPPPPDVFVPHHAVVAVPGVQIENCVPVLTPAHAPCVHAVPWFSLMTTELPSPENWPSWIAPPQQELPVIDSVPVAGVEGVQLDVQNAQ